MDLKGEYFFFQSFVIPDFLWWLLAYHAFVQEI